MTENKKPSLINIILTAGVSAGLLRNAWEVGKDTYEGIAARAPELQNAFGSVGYEILEKGAPAFLGLCCVSLVYIGGRATYKVLSQKRVTE